MATLGTEAEQSAATAPTAPTAPMLRTEFCAVHVKSSEQHGLGLFATHTIPKNNVIALYPGNVTARFPANGTFQKDDTVVWHDLEHIRQSDYAICTKIRNSARGDWHYALFEPTNVPKIQTQCSKLSDAELMSFRFDESFSQRAVFANESLFPNSKLISPMEAWPLLRGVMTAPELHQFQRDPRPVLISTVCIHANREIYTEYNNDETRGYAFSDIMLAKQAFVKDIHDGNCDLKLTVAHVYLRRLQQIIRFGIPITLLTTRAEFEVMMRHNIHAKKMAKNYKGGWKKILCDYWAVMPYLNPSLKRKRQHARTNEPAKKKLSSKASEEAAAETSSDDNDGGFMGTGFDTAA